jgi:hypothetical protein
MTQATRPRPFRQPEHARQARLASGVGTLAGVYLLISAWIAARNAGNEWNSMLAGVVVATLAARRFGGRAESWTGWLDALIGAWLIVSPWVYGYDDSTWRWNSIVVGLVIVVCGVWSAVAGDARAHPSGSGGAGGGRL